MNIAVMGTGYVGLTTAVALAHLGHDVIGIDIDQQRVDDLNQGRCPIVEDQMPQFLVAGLQQGRLDFTTNITKADTAELIFLCLPTPATPTGHPDLSFMRVACRDLRTVAAAGSMLVCKSTVPVGTNPLIKEWIDRPDITVASNPEFLREGTALADFLQPDRVVIGIDDADASAPLQEIYAAVTSNIHVVAPAEAELIKYAANAFLATKLSFVNEIARLGAATGTNPEAVLAGVGSDQRISARFLKPGPGWGGSCFPKDTLALRQLAADHGVDTPVIDGAIESNRFQTTHIVKAISNLTRSQPATIAIWGLTFKAGTDDTRDSPAVTIAQQLVADGHHVTAYDPAAKTTPIGVTRAPTAEAATVGAELLVVLTEWEEFAALSLNPLRYAMAAPHILDTRGVLDPAAVAAAGLRLLSPGPSLALTPC